MTVTEPILLVDDDPSCATAVALALGDRYELLVETSRIGAINFLKSRASEVRGVIVDLNLTESTDNFGRDILERLADLGIPCVVFSSSVSDVDAERAVQAQRFRNEFGVLDTIGKSDARNATASLVELRSCVAEMCRISMDRFRRDALGDINAVLTEHLAEAERRFLVRVKTADRAPRLAGKPMRESVKSDAEKELEACRKDVDQLREMAADKLANADTVADLEAVRIEILNRIGAG